MKKNRKNVRTMEERRRYRKGEARKRNGKGKKGWREEGHLQLSQLALRVSPMPEDTCSSPYKLVVEQQ